MYVQFESLLALLSGLLGVFIIIRLLFSHRSNINVNVFVVIVLLIVSIRFLTYGLVQLEAFELHPDFYTYLNPVSLIAVPSLLLYLKALLKDYRSFQKKVLLHFIFPLLSLALNFLQAYFEIFQNEILEVTQLCCVLVFFLVYLFFTGLELKKIVTKIVIANCQKETEHQSVILRWLYIIITIIVVWGLKWILSIVYEYKTQGIITGNSFFIVNIFIFYLISGFILFHIKILYGLPNLKTGAKIDLTPFLLKDATWVLDDKRLKSQQNETLQPSTDKKNLAYIHNIEQFVATQRPFRVLEYKLKDLASDLNVPTSHIAYLFKYYSIINFTEFKNTMRIKDAICLIDEDFLLKKTFDALATKVGFSSYNPFFVAFKRQTNLSPARYLESLAGKTEL